MTDEFEQVARLLAERIAQLLSAQVSVIDETGLSVATREARTGGPSSDSEFRDEGSEYLRVPFRFGGHTGEVVVSEPTNGEVISPRVALTLVELIINQRLASHQLQNQYELKNKFIHDLLRGTMRDEADAMREAQILGMDLNRPRSVILIDAADYILAPVVSSKAGAESRIRRRAQMVIGSVVSFFQLPNDTICAHIGDGEVAVLKASSTQDLAPWTDRTENGNPTGQSWANLTALKRAGAALLMRLRSDLSAPVSVGIGRYHPGLRGLSRSYEDASAALSLGTRFHGHNKVHCLDGLGMAAFVGISDEHTKIELARHLLSPLDQDHDLLETLDAFFFENCCPSSSATRLSIHRNTLGYRLDKIASLTGLDPRRFDDAVQIRLALLLRGLHGDMAACAGAQTEAQIS